MARSTVRRLGYGTAAPLYLAAGWVGVLPLPYGRKTPPPDGFTGRHGVDPTLAEVRAWVRRFPGGNVALRLPPQVVGLDLDLYKPDGAASYTALVDELGPLPATWRSSARDDQSGIRLFRAPTGVRWAEGRAGPGIELIHHGHRYAVVWPSRHPDGGTYQWWTPDGRTALRVPRVDELPSLPAAWGRRLSAPPTPPLTTVDTHPRMRAARGYPAACLAGAVAELAAMRPGSGRNNALNRKAYHLGGFVAAGQLDHDEVRQQLLRAAEANGHLAKHGLRQTLATIDSGLRAGMQRPRRIA
ncbi:MAG: bifunctional DNA primase/polymerase [Dactylosporangium sp.]|nr:bifunctional DNA primase/polymerase [Dactylosporangium sp.]